MAVNWAEVTAIATAILAVSLVGAFAAAIFAAQQVREARTTRQAQMATEFFRRWNDDALVETRRMVARFKSSDELREAYVAYVSADAPEAYVLYRELDYFEQLAALESLGAFDVEEAHGPGVYPLFEGLAGKLRRALDDQAAAADG